MGGGSWLYFLFYTMLNYWEFGQIWLPGGAVRSNTTIEGDQSGGQPGLEQPAGFVFFITYK